MNDEPDPMAQRGQDLKDQMQRACQLFSSYMETYINAGRMSMDPAKLKALRLDCATIAEQFIIVSEAAGNTADALLDGE